jgi:superfamily II DNA or RNA helicase
LRIRVTTRGPESSRAESSDRFVLPDRPVKRTDGLPSAVTVRLAFEEGTVRVEGLDDAPRLPDSGDLPGVEFDERSKTGRAPAHRYADVVDGLDRRGVDYEDRVFELLDLSLASTYQLRAYQQAALEDWRDAGDRGVLELPTGSGKTVIGIAAIETLGTPTLVVVPTIDLLNQWRRELETEFDVPVGQLGGGEQRVEEVTVSTYDSAYLRADELGDRFGLVVFDEVHHLGGEGYRDIARLLAAPARMGLTATFERPDGAHEVVEALVGPLVHCVEVDELAGEHLANYDIKRIEVGLTPDERAVYERHQETFTDYLARSGLQLTSGSDYRKLVMRSGNDPKAREALLAKQRAREVMMNAERKVAELETILDRHREDRVIVFTAHTDLVYRLSERFLVPAITHETGASERRTILDRFRDGDYSRVVTANVLDEGVDVPAANVGVLLAGSGSQREFTQRLGRILRPTDDGGRATLYELVSEETAEERVARRRR